MIKYDLTLERQRLIGADKFSIAANANETICLYFHFDRSWRRFDSKAAVFRNSDSKYYIIEIVADRAKVPWEVLTREGEFELSVIGFEGEKVITSDKVEVLVTESLLPEDCKTFSPSEVLFDRFRRECTAQAYLDYEDEINELKRAHTAEIMLLGEQINEADKRTQEAIEKKNDEIQQLKILYSKETNGLNRQISDLKAQLDTCLQKAEYWDLIDIALSQKTAPTYSLWSGGSQDFYLPMLNTSSIAAFSASNFSQRLKVIGLDLSSVSEFSGVFSSHKAIESLELRNCGKVSTFSNLFESCKTIRTVKIDSLKNCGTMIRFANEANMLEYVKFGTDATAANYERAFCNCVVLKEIDGCFDMSTAANTNMMFLGCASLEKVRFVENSLGMSTSFQNCVRLSKESLINIFNSLRPSAGLTLTISAYAFENAFTPQERDEWISFVTETKNWVLSIS